MEVVGSQVLPGPEEDSGAAIAANQPELQVAYVSGVGCNLSRGAFVLERYGSEGGRGLADVHHLSVQTEGGLNDAADADIFSCTEQTVVFGGDEASEWKGGAVGVGVPPA